MQRLDLIKNSLKYYWKLHLSVVAGVALATTVLVGALIVGDCVRGTLVDNVNQRLGLVTDVIFSPDRFFSEKLSQNLKPYCPNSAILFTTGMASGHGGQKRVHRVQILGVDDDFWSFSPSQKLSKLLSEDQAIINQKLAKKLDLKVGQTFVIRLDVNSSPVMSESQKNKSFRFTVSAIIKAQDFGNFSLKTDQNKPFNIFINRDFLAQKLELNRKANMIVASQAPPQSTLDKIIEIGDTSLEISQLDTMVKIQSNRVFIEPQLRQLPELQPNSATFTYLVNQIECGTNATPYSFVTGMDSSLARIGADDIIVNQWLAEDLSLKTGSLISLRYYLVDSQDQLKESAKEFKVSKIVQAQGIFGDQSLMPELPGISDVDNCKDWDFGPKIDLKNIRSQDEAYWEKYKGLPKAFIKLETAQEIWKNRYGDLTEIRISNHLNKTMVANAVMKQVSAQDFGLVFTEVRQAGMEASTTGVDFGQLFVSLSFFIYIASILLMQMLYMFSIEYRSSQIGILLALGFNQKWIRKNYLIEGFILTVPGIIIGICTAVIYANLILLGLETVWRDAVASANFNLHVNITTLALGSLISLVVMTLSMIISLKILSGNSINSLLASGQNQIKKFHSKIGIIITTLAVVGLVSIIVSVNPELASNALSLFFLAGTLTIVAGLSSSYLLLGLIAKKINLMSGQFMISLRTLTVRPWRTLTLIALISCGVFLTIGVSVNRKDLKKSASQSGRGEFELYGELTIPLDYRLDSQIGQKKYGFDQTGDVKIVYLQEKSLNDASCLNLNRVSQPTIVGVDPSDFKGRFKFINKNIDWSILAQKNEDGSINGVGDMTMIKWGLGKKIGDSIDYEDEYGREFKVKIMASLETTILQGKIIISQQNFSQKYPSIKGSKILLIDCATPQIKVIGNKLDSLLQDLGFESQSCNERLMQYASIQNTYLIIFLMLGGLGLILGTVGLGVVVLRSMLERQEEIEILSALGYQKSTINKIINDEYWFILLAGIIIGLGAALLAAVPAISSPISAIPWLTIIIIVILMVIVGKIGIKMGIKI